MVRINIEIPDELHKDAKVQSAMWNITLREFIVSAIKEKLNK